MAGDSRIAPKTMRAALDLSPFRRVGTTGTAKQGWWCEARARELLPRPWLIGRSSQVVARWR